MMFAHLLRLLLLVSSSVAARGDGSWWDLIRGDFRLIFSLALFLVNLLILTIVIYLAGLLFFGKKRSLLADAFIISLVGTVLSTAFFMFIPYRLVALFLGTVTWLILIKRLYKTEWIEAIGVGILAIVIFLVVTVLLALFFGIMETLIERFLLWF